MRNNNIKHNDKKYLSRNVFKSTRQAYGDALLMLGKTNKDVVVLCGDLTDSTKVESFLKEFPDRFVEMGIAEQNMAGVAAGLALSGKIPFISSFATFSPGRNWEQIRVSICYSKANVKIASTHSGLSASTDGPTAQALEDIAITRVLPNLVVINPIDYNQTISAVLESANHQGPVYLRLLRDETPVITPEEFPFKIGESYILNEGKDLTICSTGPITSMVINVSDRLKKENNIDAEVIACPTIKPLDKSTIIKSAKKTKKAITVEEHQIYGGFGSAVAELLSQEFPIPIKIIGINDTFCESGTYEQLKEKYGLSEEKIYQQILNFLDLNK